MRPLTRLEDDPKSDAIFVHFISSQVLTGATSGIGEATMRKFAASGFGVVGNGRNAEKLRALEEEIGPAFCDVAGDAAEIAVLNRLFDMAKDRFGGEADIVVANAGRGLGRCRCMRLRRPSGMHQRFFPDI